MDQQELSSIHSVLHLIYHRNKNQHQRAKWWKWLAALKRSTSDVALTQPAAEHAYRRHLIDNIIPRCYLAFSSVVADNQFATLGVALLATLARLAKAIGFHHELKTQARQEAQRSSNRALKEDRGERIQRVSNDLDTRPRASQNEETLPAAGKPPVKRSSKVTSEKKSSKRKKNAIDDLFSGLC